MTDAGDESSPIALADEEKRFRPEPSAGISLFDQAFVVFGIDDPDARRGDGQVVDVGLDPGNLAIVQENSTIAYASGEERRNAALAFSALRP